MSWIKHNQKVSIMVIVGILLFTSVVAFEFALRKFLGLGIPILYSSYPLYGYRLAPNQEVSRFLDSVIKVNNFGLRANEDWDHRIQDKVLFLGDSVTYGGSYISNKELFSNVAVQNLDGYKSGNAGVNAWGVENIYGLIVDTEFLPAQAYVTVLPEDDFYRGITRIQALWVWCYKPYSAIQELLGYFYYKQGSKRFIGWTTQANDEEKKKVVKKAVRKLKKMDRFLKSRGFFHVIYISPTQKQVLEGDRKDQLVHEMFENHGIEVTYLIDRIQSLNLSGYVKQTLFHDHFHLEKEGHELWGKMIGDDLRMYMRTKTITDLPTL